MALEKALWLIFFAGLLLGIPAIFFGVRELKRKEKANPKAR